MYRVESTRLELYDYGQAGWYFVTVCTKNHQCHFGHVHNGYVCLSKIGSIVASEWQRIPILRPYVHLDDWIVMPDHLHGILVIDRDRFCRDATEESVERCSVSGDDTTETPHSTAGRRSRAEPRGPLCGVSTDSASKDDIQKWQSGCLGAIVSRFKAFSFQRIRQAGHKSFTWQSRFHDRVIRGGDEIDKIRGYIRKNPIRWELKENEELPW